MRRLPLWTMSRHDKQQQQHYSLHDQDGRLPVQPVRLYAGEPAHMKQLGACAIHMQEARVSAWMGVSPLEAFPPTI